MGSYKKETELREDKRGPSAKFQGLYQNWGRWKFKSRGTGVEILRAKCQGSLAMSARGSVSRQAPWICWCLLLWQLAADEELLKLLTPTQNQQTGWRCKGGVRCENKSTERRWTDLDGRPGRGKVIQQHTKRPPRKTTEGRVDSSKNLLHRKHATR